MLSDKTVKRAAGVILTAFLVGCATPPEKIQATYTSPLLYSDYSCKQIKGEILRVNRKVINITGAQRQEATNDAVAVGVAVVLFWPAAFFLMSKDHGNELARLKGEYDALESAAIAKNCNISKTIHAARQERDSYARQVAIQNQKSQQKLSEVHVD